MHVMNNDLMNNHKYELIKTIIELYLKIKFYSKKNSLENRAFNTCSKRFYKDVYHLKLLKVLLFKGQ